MTDQPPNKTFLNTELPHKPSHALIPAGQVALGTIAGATLADGLTPIFLPDVVEGNATFYAAANQVFMQPDIGKTITCIELHGANQLVITGILMASPSYSAVSTDHVAPTILDDAIASTENAIDAFDSALSDVTVPDNSHDFTDKPLFGDIQQEPENRLYHAQTEDVESTQMHTVINAQDSIILQCGAASIMLLADGRIKINGKYIHSRASHTQRISGSVVKVN